MALNSDYIEDTQLAALLGDSVWTAFFSKFGRLRDVQKKSIPLILKGENVLISAATASGKTEAACAPLVSRYQKEHDTNPWTILYVCPTRALVNDLYKRLRTPIENANFTIPQQISLYEYSENNLISIEGLSGGFISSEDFSFTEWVRSTRKPRISPCQFTT